MLSEEQQIQMYDDSGNSYATWKITAENLLTASDVLKKQRDNSEQDKNGIPFEIQILFPELMLRGFAVECLLKSVWLKRGNKITSSGKYEGIPRTNSHNLLQLVDVNKIELTDEQRDILNRLSLIMVSSGRYPIPKKWTDNKIKRQQRGGRGVSSFWKYPSEDKKLENIVDIIYRYLED